MPLADVEDDPRADGWNAAVTEMRRIVSRHV